MNPLLKVDQLCVCFRDDFGSRTVTDHVSFEVAPGEFVGIVGESGSGKSVTSLAVMDLLPKNGAIASGHIYFDGQDLTKLSEEEMDQIRGSRLTMVYQDALASLDPVYTIGSQLRETIRAHLTKDRQEERRLAIQVLQDVGLRDPQGILKKYPHELSGGMRQRVMIAMAVVSRPQLLIADEPTTALDVTIQAEIMSMLREIQQKMGMAMILITHDIGLIAEMADRVFVMYAGQIVEEADVVTLFEKPAHPYTKMLLASVPAVQGRRDRRLVSIQGTVPDDYTCLTGCRFLGRCPFAESRCHQPQPVLTVAPGHRARCFRARENL